MVNKIFVKPTSLQNVGFKRRLSRLLPNYPAIWMPVDDSLISGPTGGLANLSKVIGLACKADVDAIMGFRGALVTCENELINTPYVLNLTASTTRNNHTKKELVSSVQEAVTCGADAVAVHVNISSSYESNMLKNMALVRRESESVGLPLLALMYTRGDKDNNYEELAHTNNDSYSDFVAHSVRIGVEMGADVIKTQFLAAPESFSKVASAAGNVPILVSGGPLCDEGAVISRARSLVANGAYGVCYGRNIYHRSNPDMFIHKLREALLKLSN